MAVLENIRNKGGVIVSVVIGIALVAFILGDFIPGGGTRNFDIADVGGKTLSLQEYERKIDEVSNIYQRNTGQTSLDERTMDMVREQAWQMLINETIMTEEYESIGLMVSGDELFDLVQGANPHSMIRQNFTDPQTGEFNRTALINFLKTKNMDPQRSAAWNAIEKELITERYAQKYNNLVAKGICVPSFMAENENIEINRKVNFDFIEKTYSSVPDSSVKVSQSDLKKYYNDNKNQWEQSATRDIEYVVFDVLPSDEDRAATDTWMNKMRSDFEASANAFQFVTLNSDVPADTRFLTEDQMPVQVAGLFNENEGTIADPYQEGNVLKLVKLAKVENRPDSVKVRQIIILPNAQTQQAVQAAIALTDSIKAAIEGGADFSALALKYSADPSVATTQGEIGWVREAEMQVGSMAETLFSLKKGEVAKMEGQQGLFVVQVTERGKEVRKVQLATLQRNILPSPRTEQEIYSKASKFAIENRTEKQFDDAAVALNINKRVATYLGENDRQIPGLATARPVVKWAFEAKVGNVSDVFTLTNAYVVAVLKSTRKKGIAPFEQVEKEIDIIVRKEKKAEQLSRTLADAAKSAQSFSDLAQSQNLSIQSASDIAFSAFSIPNVGVEPKLIGAATSLDEGSISQPISGNNGVFVVTVNQITEPEADALQQAKDRLVTTYTNRSLSESVQALRKAANVEDMRSKFY